MRLIWLIPAIIAASPLQATTIDELLEKHDKQTVLNSIFKKSGKRAHIRTDDGIKLFNMPNAEFTDAKTMQRDLAMFNLTPEQIEQDIITSQQQKALEKQQIEYDQSRYASLPPPLTPPVASNNVTPDHQNINPTPIFIPRYHSTHRRSYRRSNRRYR